MPVKKIYSSERQANIRDINQLFGLGNETEENLSNKEVAELLIHQAEHEQDSVRDLLAPNEIVTYELVNDSPRKAWTVYLTQTIHEKGKLTVHADTEEEAREKALSMVDKNNDCVNWNFAFLGEATAPWANLDNE